MHWKRYVRKSSGAFMTQEVAGELERLRTEHAQLESRLRELERHLSLSPAEQVERINLKKAKLQLKDQIKKLEAAPIASAG
jgi:uncharacterized protein YdcH (DUF465 family)